MSIYYLDNTPIPSTTSKQHALNYEANVVSMESWERGAPPLPSGPSERSACPRALGKTNQPCKRICFLVLGSLAQKERSCLVSVLVAPAKVEETDSESVYFFLFEKPTKNRIRNRLFRFDLLRINEWRKGTRTDID